MGQRSNRRAENDETHHQTERAERRDHRTDPPRLFCRAREEHQGDQPIKNGRRQALRANRTGLEIIYRPIG